MDTRRNGTFGPSWRLATTRHIEFKFQKVISSISSQIYGSGTQEKVQSRKKHVRRDNRGENILFRYICIQKFVRGKQYKAEKERLVSNHSSQKRIVTLKFKKR